MGRSMYDRLLDLWSRLPVDVAPAVYYCERGGSMDMAAEPINAATNLAFILAAVLAACRIWSSTLQGDERRSMYALSGLMALVGVGSALFHTQPISVAKWADIIPIGLFMLAALAMSLRGLIGVSRLLTKVMLVAFLGATGWIVLATRFLPCPAAARLSADDAWWNIACLNGGTAYLPALFAYLAVTVMLVRRHQAARGPFEFGAMAFVAGFAARTVDVVKCPVVMTDGFAITGHALWHVAMALVALATTEGLLRGLTTPRPDAEDRDAGTPDENAITGAAVRSRS